LHVHVLNIIVIWQTPCNKRYVSSVISEGDTLHLHQWIVTDVFFYKCKHIHIDKASVCNFNTKLYALNCEKIPFFPLKHFPGCQNGRLVF